MKTAIIFGANGQDGFYLSELLESNEVNVIPVSRKGNCLQTNIASFSEVSELVNQYRPDYIFHLAANSTTSHDALFENHETICTGTINILESVRLHSPKTKVFISGSGLQFQNNNKPIKESDPFEARDAYSVCRIQSVYASRYYRSKGIQVYVGYFFNHDSPRRNERHMAQKIAKAVLRIAEGSKEKIEIGDLNAIKEWTYAVDVVRGIWMLVNQDSIFEANIGSGIGYSILDWVKLCFSIVNLPFESYIITNPDYTSPYNMLVSDTTLISSIGFRQTVSFEELAQIMLSKQVI